MDIEQGFQYDPLARVIIFLTHNRNTDTVILCVPSNPHGSFYVYSQKQLGNNRIVIRLTIL